MNAAAVVDGGAGVIVGCARVGAAGRHVRARAAECCNRVEIGRSRVKAARELRHVCTGARIVRGGRLVVGSGHVHAAVVRKAAAAVADDCRRVVVEGDRRQAAHTLHGAAPADAARHPRMHPLPIGPVGKGAVRVQPASAVGARRAQLRHLVRAAIGATAADETGGVLARRQRRERRRRGRRRGRSHALQTSVRRRRRRDKGGSRSDPAVGAVGAGGAEVVL